MNWLHVVFFHSFNTQYLVEEIFAIRLGCVYIMLNSQLFWVFLLLFPSYSFILSSMMISFSWHWEISKFSWFSTPQTQSIVFFLWLLTFLYDENKNTQVDMSLLFKNNFTWNCDSSWDVLKTVCTFFSLDSVFISRNWNIYSFHERY